MSQQQQHPLDNALSLDVSVLINLLKRNRCAHGRTRYYQKTSMVVRALQRYNVLQIRQQISEIQTRIQALQANKKRKRRRPEQEEWVVGSLQKNSDKEDTLRQDLIELKEILTKHLPEVISRIHHAASVLKVELARGFFMPLCTVAFAALARVRVLIMRLGREGLGILQSSFAQWNELMVKDERSLIHILSNEFSVAMNVFAENGGGPTEKEKKRQARERLLKALGRQPKLSTSSSFPKPESSQMSSEEPEKEKSNDAETTKATISEDVGESVDVIRDDLKRPGDSRGVKGDEILIDSTLEPDPMSLPKAINSSSIKSKKRKSQETDKETKSRKKKKKKKSKKKDIFDEIFGDT